jgi:hypothetical protein
MVSIRLTFAGNHQIRACKGNTQKEGTARILCAFDPGIAAVPLRDTLDDEQA